MKNIFFSVCMLVFNFIVCKLRGLDYINGSSPFLESEPPFSS